MFEAELKSNDILSKTNYIFLCVLKVRKLS